MSLAIEYYNWLYLITTIFDIGIMIGIIIIYGLNAVYRIRFIRMVEKNPYRWVDIYKALLSSMFSVTFGIMLFQFIREDAIPVSNFAILLIRPTIFLMGCTLFASIRIRFNLLEQGGGRWAQYKYRTL